MRCGGTRVVTDRPSTAGRLVAYRQLDGSGEIQVASVMGRGRGGAIKAAVTARDGKGGASRLQGPRHRVFIILLTVILSYAKLMTLA